MTSAGEPPAQAGPYNRDSLSGIVKRYLTPAFQVVEGWRRGDEGGSERRSGGRGSRAGVHDFHIHLATERYQEFGAREDAYAEPTNRYETFQDAVHCLLADASFDVPPEPQRDFFEEDGDVN